VRKRSKARGFYHLPKDPANWSEKVYAKLGVEPVHGTARPAYESLTQSINGRAAEQVNGQWVQKWTVNEKYTSVEPIREMMLRRLENIAESKRNAGVTVNGVRVSTRPESVGKLAAARGIARGNRKVVVDRATAVTMNQKQFDDMNDAVADYLQGCEDRHAELIEEIKGSDSPASVDIQSGWPSA